MHDDTKLRSILVSSRFVSVDARATFIVFIVSPINYQGQPDISVTVH